MISAIWKNRLNAFVVRFSWRMPTPELAKAATVVYGKG